MTTTKTHTIPYPIPPKYYRLIQALRNFAERKLLEEAQAGQESPTGEHEDSAPVVPAGAARPKKRKPA